MEIAVLFLITLIFFVIAETVGRGKHIGRWWSFALLMGGFIPGIIALALSPSAKGEPTRGTKGHIITGWFVLIVLGVIGMIPYFFGGSFGSLGYGIAFIILGIYLIQLGNNKIENNNPKYYFDNLKPLINNTLPVNSKTTHSQEDKVTTQQQATETKILNNSKQSNVSAPPIPNENKYYIVENGKESEPMTYEQLKEKKITENTLVWRNGLEKWVKAKDLKEINNLIIFKPPPIPIDISESIKNRITYKHQIQHSNINISSTINSEIDTCLVTLKEVSKSLNDSNIFLEKSWVLLINDKNVLKYIFKKNHEIIYSFNGEIMHGIWSYFANAKSLLIEINNEKYLFNEIFIDDDILIFIKEGYEGYFILINNQLINENEILFFLNKIKIKKYNLLEFELLNKEGVKIQVPCSNSNFSKGKKCFLVNEDFVTIETPNGFYVTKNNLSFNILNGILINIYKTHYFEANSGNKYEIHKLITINCDFFNYGNFVTENGNNCTVEKIKVDFSQNPLYKSKLLIIEKNTIKKIFYITNVLLSNGYKLEVERKNFDFFYKGDKIINSEPVSPIPDGVYKIKGKMFERIKIKDSVVV